MITTLIMKTQKKHSINGLKMAMMMLNWRKYDQIVKKIIGN